MSHSSGFHRAGTGASGSIKMMGPSHVHVSSIMHHDDAASIAAPWHDGMPATCPLGTAQTLNGIGTTFCIIGVF